MVGKSRARWGDGRIEVTAKWAEISEALTLEWPLTRIYEQHIDQTKIGYSQFRRHVQNRLGSGRSATESPETEIVAPPTDVSEPRRKIVGTTNVRHDQSRRTFHFDPSDEGTDRDKFIGAGRRGTGQRVE
jgi:hypothetical protein